MSKQQSFIKQRIDQKRGSLKRARKKKFQHLRNSGGYMEYYKQKRGLAMKTKTIKSSTGSGIPQTLDVRKEKITVSSIFNKIFKKKKLNKKKKHAKNIL